MNSKWFKGVNGGDKEKRRKEVYSYQTAFEDLDQLLDYETAVPDYDIPSWSHKQADQNGYNRAIREVKNLINLK